MKRIVWKAGRKQTFMAACVVVGATLTACGQETAGDQTTDGAVGVFVEEVANEQATVEKSVITESQIDAVKDELNQQREDKRNELKTWSKTELTGVWGNNSYTQMLLKQVKNNGADTYLTFAREDKGSYDAAIVIAGNLVEEGKLKGSAWYVNTSGCVEPLEQNIVFVGDTLEGIQNTKEFAAFLNFSQDGVERGRIIGFGDTASWELLQGVDGVKKVLEDASVEVLAQVETELGVAKVRYQYALEGRQFTKLDTTVLSGGEYLAAVDLKSLPWTQDAFHASAISRESWDNPIIIGEQYIPQGAEAEILRGLIPDYSNDWQGWSDDYWSKWDSERSYYQIFQMQETENFSVYGTYIDSRMMIETYDGSYVQIDGYFTSNYGVQPQALESDFDMDGSNELAIITLTKHGTGVCINDMWMVDRAFDGKWYVYELQQDWYSCLDELYAYQDTEQGLALIIKDEVTAVYPDVLSDVSEKYGVGNHIYFEFKEDVVVLRTLFQVYVEDMMMPVYSGGYLRAELGYQGDGKWIIRDYAYEDEACDLY